MQNGQHDMTYQSNNYSGQFTIRHRKKHCVLTNFIYRVTINYGSGPFWDCFVFYMEVVFLPVIVYLFTYLKYSIVIILLIKCFYGDN